MELTNNIPEPSPNFPPCLFLTAGPAGFVFAKSDFWSIWSNLHFGWRRKVSKLRRNWKFGRRERSIPLLVSVVSEPCCRVAFVQMGGGGIENLNGE